MPNKILKIACIIILVAFVKPKVNAQNFYNKKLHIFNWGYGTTNSTFKTLNVTNQKANIAQAPLTYEFLKKYSYFYTDLLTPMVDLSLGAFNEQYWFGHERDGYIFNGGDWPLIRSAFGGYITNNIGVYVGGQWGYSHWRVAPGYYNDKDQLVYHIQQEQEFGGHTFGPGAHIIIDFDKFLIRNSIMYDFVTKGFKGERYTGTMVYDIMAMYALTNDNMIGVFANVVYAPSRFDVIFFKFRAGLSIAFSH
jgi:hypothetical protein